MVNFVRGPIVAAMGTAEGVVVKARELIGAVLGRADTSEEASIDEEATEEEPEADTARLPVPAAGAGNGQMHPED